MWLHYLPVTPTGVRNLMAGLRRLRQEYAQVQGRATEASLRRGRVLVLFAVPVHALAAWWCLEYAAQAVDPLVQAWAKALVWLEGGVSVALLVCGLLAHGLLRSPGKAAGRVGLVVQCAMCVAYLAFGVAASILDVGVGNGAATLLVICMGVAILSLMRPLVSLPMFATTFGLFWVLVDTSHLNAATAAGVQIQAIISVLMAQLISVMMWHQYTRTALLERDLVLSNEALLRKQQQLEHLAGRDTLTGLYNRRKFMELAEQELGRAARIPCEVCVVMVDLDFFKQINDQHGHPVGDQVLQRTASRLATSVRTTDLVARMGGEEFIVLLPDTSAAGALVLAEKLRLALRDTPLELDHQAVSITASFGVSGVGPQQRVSIDALYSAADRALYQAKKRGRDRVEWMDADSDSAKEPLPESVKTAAVPGA